MTQEIRMLSASGLLGYGFPESSLEAGMDRKPHMIGVDGGSSDPGAHYLGSGKCVNSRMAMKRDLTLLLRAAIANDIPLIIGSCGGAGGEPHLQACVDLVHEIAREEDLHFRLAVIHSEQDKDVLKDRLTAGRIFPLNGAEPLDAETIDRAERIVGMMGPEPYMTALDEGAQVVLAGRSTDAAPWAAMAMRAQLPAAQSWYAGKMLECGTGAAIPKGHDCLLVSVREDHLICEPTNPARRCTPLSVGVQALHENADPNRHVEPGGILDASACRIEAVSDRAVKVSGMEWQPDRYTVKLEAAEHIGYSAISFAGVRDPLLIAAFDRFIETVRDAVAVKTEGFGVTLDQYQLIFRIYGANAVMGELEPIRDTATHELGILVEALAATQDVANAVLAIARVSLMHTDFPNRLCKEGNMAFPFSPSDLERGSTYRFSLSHAIEPRDPQEMFPIEYQTL